MSRFQKSGHREVPTLNTASLPDLIFTILFFFMIVTHMRPVPIKTQFNIPQATELQQLKEKDRVVYIMVGQTDTNNNPKSPYAIQFDSDLTTLDGLSGLLNNKIESLSLSSGDKITAVLKIDKNAPMGLISNIKQKLRESGVSTIHYSLEKGNQTSI